MSKKKKNQNAIIVPDDPEKGLPLWINLIMLAFWPLGTLAGVYFLVRRIKNEGLRQKYRNYRHYAAIIGDRGSVSIRELATRLGKSPDQVADDLQSMINTGIIDARAYIDRSAMMLYLSDDVVETEFVSPTVNIYVNNQGQQSQAVETHFVDVHTAPGPGSRRGNHGAVREAAEEPVAEAAPAAPEAPRKPAAPQRTGTDNEDFEEKLRQIRELNDEIDNETVSRNIDRIGALTASIFRVVREKPERADEVRKFMNYYLPTTFKLLKSYSLMEKQSYQGENIIASRKKIEDVLENLVHAFEQQQDKLFQSDALDVETDISVLQTMMASDGLTRQEGGGLHL